MRNYIILSSILLSLSLLVGCGGERNEASKTENETNPKLTTEQLVGEWCYAYYEAGYGDDKEREEENITYIFKDDGTLLYQNNAASSIDRPGSYELANGELKIKPTLMFLPGTIRSVSDDRIEIGSATTHLVFTHGACSE